MYMGFLDASRVCIKRVRAYTSDDPQRAKKVRSSAFASLAPLSSLTKLRSSAKKP